MILFQQSNARGWSGCGSFFLESDSSADFFVNQCSLLDLYLLSIVIEPLSQPRVNIFINLADSQRTSAGLAVFLNSTLNCLKASLLLGALFLALLSMMIVVLESLISPLPLSLSFSIPKYQCQHPYQSPLCLKSGHMEL